MKSIKQHSHSHLSARRLLPMHHHMQKVKASLPSLTILPKQKAWHCPKVRCYTQALRILKRRAPGVTTCAAVQVPLMSEHEQAIADRRQSNGAASVSVAREAIGSVRQAAGHLATLMVQCPDQKGVIAALAQLLYGLGKSYRIVLLLENFHLQPCFK